MRTVTRNSYTVLSSTLSLSNKFTVVLARDTKDNVAKNSIFIGSTTLRSFEDIQEFQGLIQEAQQLLKEDQWWRDDLNAETN